MSGEIATRPKQGLGGFMATREQVELIKRTVAKGATDDELKLFLYTAKKTGLDPLLRQIHAVKRWDSRLQQNVMSIQTGIDGYRLIADRTKRYSPSKEPTFVQDEDGKLISATAYIKKKTEDGEWHEVSATAYYEEYVQTTREGKTNRMWTKMPHGQTAKCAEALAIRKAFPAETAGVRTDEEMEQADNFIPTSASPQEETPLREPQAKPKAEPEPKAEKRKASKPKGKVISEAQARRFYAIRKSNERTDEETQAFLDENGFKSDREITKDFYEEAVKWAERK